MPEDLKNRTCATCACVYIIEPPRVMVDLNAKVAPGTKPVYICRLNPPDLILTPDGPKIAQRQTLPYISCWSWKEAGTLPGDVLSPKTFYVEENLPPPLV